MSETNQNMWRSLAISFRIELAFHAANNEGAGGTNVMEPRRITVGDKEYDGISGEIVRRHILENFVKLCQQNNIPLHDRCKGLAPDRGLVDFVQLIQSKNWQYRDRQGRTRPGIEPVNYPEATEILLRKCALCDVGGFMYPLGEAVQNISRVLGQQIGSMGGGLKRDSCFEVGWLISEHPAIVNYTQHSAYDPDPERHNLFVQNMRVGIYGGVIRIDLDRIGRNDWWWLNPKKGEGTKIDEFDISEEDLKKLIKNKELPTDVKEKLEELLQTHEVNININEIGKNTWEITGAKSRELILKKEGEKLMMYEPNGFEEYALSPQDRLKRDCLLLEAIKKWLLSPSFAKQTGWLQHQSGLLEGSIVLSKDGAAPFASPIKFEIEEGKPMIKKNENYRDILKDVVGQDTNHYKKYDFNNPKELIDAINETVDELKCQGTQQ